MSASLKLDKNRTASSKHNLSRKLMYFPVLRRMRVPSPRRTKTWAVQARQRTRQFRMTRTTPLGQCAKHLRNDNDYSDSEAGSSAAEVRNVVSLCAATLLAICEAGEGDTRQVEP